MSNLNAVTAFKIYRLWFGIAEQRSPPTREQVVTLPGDITWEEWETSFATVKDIRKACTKIRKLRGRLKDKSSNELERDIAKRMLGDIISETRARHPDIDLVDTRSYEERQANCDRWKKWLQDMYGMLWWKSLTPEAAEWARKVDPMKSSPIDPPGPIWLWGYKMHPSSRGLRLEVQGAGLSV